MFLGGDKWVGIENKVGCNERYQFLGREVLFGGIVDAARGN